MTGNLIPMRYMNGLASAILTEILVPGEDTETDEDLRERYFEYVRNPAYGGNIADYKRKVKLLDGVGQVKVFPVWNGGGTVKLVLLDSNNEKPTEGLIDIVDYKRKVKLLDGVGQVKVFPVWNGGGTVKLVLLDSNNEKPTEGLIDIVQEKVDPNPQQQGRGIAPIGHLVTVVGAESRAITIETTLVNEQGYSKEYIQTSIKAAIHQYFKSLIEEWETKDIVLRIAHIESKILDVKGVIDVQGTTLNGSSGNLILSEIEIPILSDVVVRT